MSDLNPITRITASAKEDIIIDLSESVEPESMELYDDNPIISDHREKRSLPEGFRFSLQPGGDITDLLAMENDQFAKTRTVQQMDTPSAVEQINNQATFIAPTMHEMALYDDPTSETYRRMLEIDESDAIRSASNEYPGYIPAVASTPSQQQRQPQHVPDWVSPTEKMLWTALAGNSQQARVEADDIYGNGTESLASQSLNADWSGARQSYMQNLPHRPALVHQHQAFQQLLQQPVLQQQSSSIRQNNKRKRKVDRSASFTRAPKRGKVVIERAVTENGDRRVITSVVTPAYAAAVEKNEKDLCKKVKNSKRQGLAKGLKAARYQKRCHGDSCNEFETECRCPGGFVN